MASLLGIACSVGVLIMAVMIVDNHKGIGIYLMFCGIIMTFLEISCILEKMFGCCGENSFARRCWLVVLSIDNWKRGLLYLALSAACYVNLKQTWQVLLAGGLMDLCGLLYFIKTIKTKKQIDPYKYKQLSVT